MPYFRTLDSYGTDKLVIIRVRTFNIHDIQVLKNSCEIVIISDEQLVYFIQRIPTGLLENSDM